MGWGMDVTMYLSKVSTESLDSVTEDLEDSLERARASMMVLAAAGPAGMPPDQDWEWHEYLPIKMGALMEELEESCVKLALCREARGQTGSKEIEAEDDYATEYEEPDSK